MKLSNDTPSPDRPGLDAAYRGAVYTVDAPGGAFAMAVDELSPELDALFARLGVGEAAFVSAANPGSARLSDEENRRRGEALRDRVAASGRQRLSGRSAAADGDWEEESLLVLGIGAEEAVALARDFGQAAILVLRAGEPVRLRFLGTAEVA